MRHKYASWIREVAEQIEVLGVPRKRQEELGWSDFHADPPPATEFLHEFASLAVELCCFDEEGRWGRQNEILYAILTSTETLSSTRVDSHDVEKLVAMVKTGDSQMDGIKFWFQVHFPPPKN